MNRLRIGTRGSALAVRQAQLVKEQLLVLRPGLEIEIVHLVSKGDLKQGTPQAENGDKKDWIAGLEEAILEGRVDLTVNSSKDVPLDILPGTELSPVLCRESPFDLLIAKENLAPGWTVHDLPVGAILGTASLRRQAQLRALRPDLRLVNVRGNINTRLAKLQQSEDLYGIVLAEAGIRRLALGAGFSLRKIPPEIILPAVNQGILAAQYASANEEVRALLQASTDAATIAEWSAERAVIETLGADCRSAVGVFAETAGSTLQIRAQVLAVDGSESLSGEISGPRDLSSELGRTLGQELLEKGAKRLL